jgi:hemerythrin-like domain-containing protein
MSMSNEDMSPSELSQWMRRERETLIDLNKVLRQHIAAKPDVNLSEWLRGLRIGFERLQKHLERHFAAKEANGYLSMVIEQRPTLSGQVEQMRNEHDEILHLGEQILRDLGELLPENRVLLADACARVQRFMAVVADHDQREIMITMYVFSQDIGETG